MFTMKNKARFAGIVACIFGAFGSVYGALALAPGIANAQPNIIVIMADDLDLGSFNVMIEELMPNTVTHLIDQGITFTNAFVSTSLCCPSRATFLTGQYAHNHEVKTNFPPDGSVTKFDDISTLPTWLQGAGYHTGFVGKYLNGYGTDQTMLTESEKDDADYIPPGWNDWQALIGNSTYRVYTYGINDNLSLALYGEDDTDYQTDVLALRAAEFIADADMINDAQPFFLWVSPLAPHVESAAPDVPGCTGTFWNKSIRPAPRHLNMLVAVPPKPDSFDEDDMSDKPPFLQGVPPMTLDDKSCVKDQYLDRLKSLGAIDDMVGTIFDKLIDLDELANTIVIFTSDNGFFLGHHRLTHKLFAYEESIRVPLIYRPAGGTTPIVVDRYVINNDLAPTIVELAGATAGLVADGRSFVPLLTNPSAPWRKRFLVTSLLPFPAPAPLVGNIPAFTAVRSSSEDTLTPNRLYVLWQNGPDSIEFYDLTNDAPQMESKHDDPSFEAERQLLEDARSALSICGSPAGSVACGDLED